MGKLFYVTVSCDLTFSLVVCGYTLTYELHYTTFTSFTDVEISHTLNSLVVYRHRATFVLVHYIAE